jgi:hypothetical protein
MTWDRIACLLAGLLAVSVGSRLALWRSAVL